MKLGATGAPVPAFSGDGVAETRFGASGGSGCGSSGLAFGVVDGGAGRVLITGQATTADCIAHFAVARFRADGLLDPLWGPTRPKRGVTWLPSRRRKRGTDLAGHTRRQGPGSRAAVRTPSVGLSDRSADRSGAAHRNGRARLILRLRGRSLAWFRRGSASMPTDGTSSFRRTAGLSSRASAGRRAATTRRPALVRYLGDAPAPIPDGDGDGSADSAGQLPDGREPRARRTPTATDRATPATRTPNGGDGQQPPPGSPPFAEFTSKSRSPTMAGAIWLNGKSSTAAAGRSIVSYAWDLTSDGKFDFVAGGNARRSRRPSGRRAATGPRSR